MNPGGWQKVFQYKGKKVISNTLISVSFRKSRWTEKVWSRLEKFIKCDFP